jgi:orotate phosphoribosyltransferase
MNLGVARKAYDGDSVAFDLNDQRLRRLRQIITDESLMMGDFTLSSGRKSKYLFQLRQTTLNPEGSTLIGDLFVDFMKRSDLHCAGGLELGAVPVVTAIAVMAFQKGYPLSTFFVRKEPKLHGAREQIDGHLIKGGKVLVVDDVTTSGDSMLDAAKAIRAGGCKIDMALSVVDREEGAAENLASEGIKLFSLFKRQDFPIG